MPPTADPTARKTSSAVPTNSTATERASVGDMPTSAIARSRSPVSPLGTAVRAAIRVPRPGDGRQSLGHAPSPARRSPVEEVLDDRARAPGRATVVVEELPRVAVRAVAAGPGDARQLQAWARQLVAGPAAHQEDGVARAGGHLPRRSQRLGLLALQQPGVAEGRE